MFVQNLYQNLSSWFQQNFVGLSFFWVEKLFKKNVFLNVEPSKKGLYSIVEPTFKEEEKQKAAATIQKAVRKYFTEKNEALSAKMAFLERDKAARCIQKTVKKHLAKKEKCANAAKVIQRAFRAHLQHKKERKAASLIQKACYEYSQFAKSHFLALDITRQSRKIIDGMNVSQLPRAASGRTPVYFPYNIPVVLKKTNHHNSQERWKKAVQAKIFCEGQGYHHLDIPLARSHQDWIIESRLPIPTSLNQKQQIGLYIENKDAFTSAVLEFTAFLCQVQLEDLSGQTSSHWVSLCETDLPRYDNAPLYITEEGKGKIGLVDLETFAMLCEPPSQEHIMTACMQAIRLFPLHVSEILEVAQKFNLCLDLNKKKLQKEESALIKYFDVVYRNHRSYIEQHQIFPSKTAEEISCTAEEMSCLVKKGVLCLDKHKENLSRITNPMELDFCLFLASASPEQKATFEPFAKKPDKIWDFSIDLRDQLEEKIIPQLYSIVFSYIHETLTNQLFKLEEPISYPQFLFARSLFPRKSELQDRLRGQFSKALEPVSFENLWQKEYLIVCLIDELLKILAEEGKIAYYQPESGFKSDPSVRIFV